MLIVIILLAFPPCHFGIMSLTHTIGEDFGWLGSVLFGLPCVLIQLVVLAAYVSGERWQDEKGGHSLARALTVISGILAVLGAAKPFFW